MLDRAERALRSLANSVTRLPDSADGRPHLQAVIGSGCLGMNMAVVTVVAGPHGTLAPRGVAFEGIVKQRAGRKAVELCRTRLLRDQAPHSHRRWPYSLCSTSQSGQTDPAGCQTKVSGQRTSAALGLWGPPPTPRTAPGSSQPTSSGSSRSPINDETIRFNVLLVDDEVGVVQPYLSTARGVESPTFLLRRRRQRPGLYAVFEQMFQWLTEQSTPE